MARIRTIKPQFWQDEKIAKLSRDARLTFLGLISALADDEGRLRVDPRLVRGAIYPYDDALRTKAVEKHLDQIEAQGLIVRYTVQGESYAFVRNWVRHQRIDKPQPSRLPEPPASNSQNGLRTFNESSENVQRAFSTEGEGEGDGRGNGKGSRNGRGAGECYDGADAPSAHSLVTHGARETIAEHLPPDPASTPDRPALPPHEEGEHREPDADFEAAWSRYPRRAGGNPKNAAAKAWRARIRAGVDPAEMLAGVERYRAWCVYEGKINTEFVMQAKRFFGPDLSFAEEWRTGSDESDAASNPFLDDQAAAFAADEAAAEERRSARLSKYSQEELAGWPQRFAEIFRRHGHEFDAAEIREELASVVGVYDLDELAKALDDGFLDDAEEKELEPRFITPRAFARHAGHWIRWAVRPYGEPLVFRAATEAQR